MYCVHWFSYIILCSVVQISVSEMQFIMPPPHADVLSQHAGTGATWQINTKILLCRNRIRISAKILSTCRGQRHIVSPCSQLVLSFIIVIVCTVHKKVMFFLWIWAIVFYYYAGQMLKMDCELEYVCIVDVDVNQSIRWMAGDMTPVCVTVMATVIQWQSQLTAMKYHQEQLPLYTSMMCTTLRAAARSPSVVLLVLWQLYPTWPPKIHWCCSVEMHLIHLSVCIFFPQCIAGLSVDELLAAYLSLYQNLQFLVSHVFTYIIYIEFWLNSGLWIKICYFYCSKYIHERISHGSNP